LGRAIGLKATKTMGTHGIMGFMMDYDSLMELFLGIYDGLWNL
jgi:hypothetical protein